MSKQVSHLPVAEGGIGLPDIREEFHRLSEATVKRWRTATSPVAAAAGRVLLASGTAPESLPSPSVFRLPAPPARLWSSLPGTGLARLRSAAAPPRGAHELDLLRRLLPATGGGAVTVKWWKHGWLHCRFDRHSAILGELKRVQEAQYGTLNSAVLAAAPLARAGVCLHTADQGVSASAYARLFSADATVGSVVELEWVGPLHLRFRSCRDADSLDPAQITAFRRLCDTVVFNYPALLQPQNPPDVLQPRPPTVERWSVRQSGRGTEILCDHGGGAVTNLGIASSSKHAASLARTVDPSVVRFDPHPSLVAFAPLWTPRQPQRPPAISTLSPLPASPGHREVASRAARAVADDELLGTALAKVTWKRLSRLEGSSSAQRLLFHKRKGLRLSGWDRTTERRGCPHCVDACDDTGHVFHIMWSCPAAQYVWTEHLRFWQRLGLWQDCVASDSTFAAAVFGLRLPQTPASVWGFVDQRAIQLEDVDDVQSALQVVWHLQVLAGFQHIWQWRHGMADAVDPWTAAAALSAFRSSQIAAIHKAGGGTHARSKEVVHSICRGLLHFLALPHPVSSSAPASTGRFLLFFDGGSRENPGPGGAGAVVVHVNTFGCGERIAWSAAMSLANAKTTNNHAEYVGLVSGLRAAQAYSWRPLSVVGDSAMILSQLRDSRPPRHPRLRRLYGRARILADSVGVKSWVHHYRAFNKMADAAANIAMDARTSVQTLYPTSRPIWQGLPAHLQGDLNQWRASTYPDPPSSG